MKLGKIGILGSGVVAKELAKGLSQEGYVMLGTRSKEKLEVFAKEVKVEIGSFKEAAEFGEIIILATHGLSTTSALDLAGIENFKDKLVIDATNPLDFTNGVPPKLLSSQGMSLGEQIQAHIPEAKVVKAFNTIAANIMTNPSREEGDPDLFIAGNDQKAKDKVKEIAESFGWKSIIDMGDIKNSYLLENLARLWIEHGFRTKEWTHAFKLLRK